MAATGPSITPTQRPAISETQRVEPNTAPDTAPEFNFGSGMPDPKTFPAQNLAAAAQRTILREGASLVRYPDARGYLPLREIAAQRFRRNHQMPVDASDVTITAGSMQSIILAIQALLHPGDTVLVEEFCYSGTLGCLRQFGAQIAGVPIDGHGLRIDALDETLGRLHRDGQRVAFVYTIATHQNPSGTILPLERRRDLLAVCKRHGVVLVEDDCYADVVFDGNVPQAMYALADPGDVLYIGSFSKVLGPGIRLGYFIAPESLTGRLLAYKRDGGTNALASIIVAGYFQQYFWQHVQEVCDAVRHKRDTLFAALQHELGGLVDWTRPQGGLFTWITLPDGIDLRTLDQLLKARNVLYGTGRSFDAADREINYLRLAFGYIDAELIPEGIARLGECIEQAAPGGRLPAAR